MYILGKIIAIFSVLKDFPLMIYIIPKCLCGRKKKNILGISGVLFLSRRDPGSFFGKLVECT